MASTLVCVFAFCGTCVPVCVWFLSTTTYTAVHGNIATLAILCMLCCLVVDGTIQSDKHVACSWSEARVMRVCAALLV